MCGNGLHGPPAVNSSISAAYWPLSLPSRPHDVIEPTAITVLPSGAYIYVAAYDATTTPGANYVFGFAVGSGGVLTPLNGGAPLGGTQPGGAFAAGTCTGAFLTRPIP